MMKKPSLLLRIIIAMVLGNVCSLFFPVWAVRVFATFSSLFSNFLEMFIPLLIIGLVVPGIADLGKGAGKLLSITAAIAYLSTVLSGFLTYFTCKLTYPSLLGNSTKAMADLDLSNEIAPYFTIEMPAFISVMTALVTAFILGIGLSLIKGTALKNAMDDFKDIITSTISYAVIPLLPLYIFCIFLKMGAEGNILPVMGMFLKVVAIIFAMHVTLLVLQFAIGGAVAKKNPFKALKTMLPAYVTALGTSSSAATIPVTLQCVKKLGVNEQVADFTVPLCATIHLSCSMLKIVACTYAIGLGTGVPVGFDIYCGFIFMLGITMVAAPGIPGGAIMSALGLIGSMLGFGSGALALVMALYMTMDSFGTAGNVTGDGAISLIVDKLRKHPELSE